MRHPAFRLTLLASTVALALSAHAAPTAADRIAGTELIARDALFGNPEQGFAGNQVGAGDAVGGGWGRLGGKGDRDSRGQQREAECGTAHGRTPGWQGRDGGQDARRREM